MPSEVSTPSLIGEALNAQHLCSLVDIVKTHMKGLDVYRLYCVNQSNAARTLNDLKAADPSLKTLVDVGLKHQGRHAKERTLTLSIDRDYV